MNKAPWIFLGVLFTLRLSWWGMVYGPASQLGGQSAANDDGTAVLPRVGLAQQGEQVYRANGCYYCHTRTATGGEPVPPQRTTQPIRSNRLKASMIGAMSFGRANKRIALRDDTQRRVRCFFSSHFLRLLATSNNHTVTSTDFFPLRSA